MKLFTVTVLLLAGTSSAAFAQSEADRHGDHAGPPPEIVVTALQRNRDDVLSGTSVLSGEDLQAARRTSLGETLAGLPGVSATSFGPTASRPILRGFQGDRIRILTDGIGSFDASTVSVDHAVTINPMTAERVEVLRGPAALLYGSSAIGGAINVVDNRIPRRIPDEGVHAEANAGYGSAADERTAAGRVDLPLTRNFVLHFDGSYARTDDLRSGGYILAAPLRAEAAESDDPEISELAERRGRIENTASRTWEVAGGAAFVDDDGSLGVSVSRYDSLYGVPPRYALEEHDHDHDHEDHDHEESEEHEHGHSHEDVRLDAHQTRVDLRGEVRPVTGFLDRITLRAGYADYRHDEIEDTGEIGTSFFNEGLEGRLEFSQRRRGAWGGAFGAQYLARDFTVVGEEAFLPPTRTEQAGLFTVQSFDFGALRAEIGTRYERTSVEASASEPLGTPDAERRFNAFSASAGALYQLVPGWRVGLNLTHSERAPTAEELFSNGAHLATQSYEIGDPLFEKERSNGAELLLRGRAGGLTLEVSGYYNDFSNFIYQAPTGEEIDELPVFAFAQGGAKQYGFEAEVNATLAELGSGRITADAIADYVRVEIDGQGSAPFIPPLRLLGGLEYQSDPIVGRIEVEHVTRQDEIAAFETETPGYTMTNARIEWRPAGPDGLFSLRLAANNIFDVEARRHSSFLKDYAPLAGRDIRVGASIRF